METYHVLNLLFPILVMISMWSLSLTNDILMMLLLIFIYSNIDNTMAEVIIYSFVIGFFSDILLNFLSRIGVLSPLMVKYFNRVGFLRAAIFGGLINVWLTLATITTLKLINKDASLWFCLPIAFIYGALSGHLVQNSYSMIPLNEFYVVSGWKISRFWDGISIVWSMSILLLINNKIKNFNGL